VSDGPKVTSEYREPPNRSEAHVTVDGKPSSKRVRRSRSGGAARPARRPKMGQHCLGEIAGKTVIEVGPGTGVLTEMVCRSARRLIAIEMDRVLAAQLRMQFALSPNVEIIEGDILAIDIPHLLGPKPGTSRPGLQQEPERVRLVGNLPYYITSPILLRLFECHDYFETIVVMVQREVADRIIAKPGGRDYGLLSATTQMYCRVEKLFDLPPGAFNPPPKVHSTVLRLNVHPQFEKLRVPKSEFIDFLKLLFAQKRKTLSNNLRSRYDSKQLAAALRRAGVQPAVRAEALSLEKMAALWRVLHPATVE